MNLELYLNSLRQEGYMAYEYNPFHNYQTSVDIYKVLTDVGIVKVPEGLGVVKKNGLLVNKVLDGYKDKFDNYYEESEIISSEDITNNPDNLYAKAGSLIDFDTEKLNFDLNHPVDIQVQPSYDGSVNLILNDGKNIPRLINSRFSTRQRNRYEIVDRIGENDTNIYNSESFDKDTSLYFLYEENPIIKYEGFISGVLPVGLYCFYLTYCDSDENESDYIAESGLIPVFIGNDSDPNSMDGGIKNQLTDKGIRLKVTNLDKSYNYLKLYYVRYFADYQLHRINECKKLYKRIPINSSTVFIQLTGNELVEDLDPNILNLTRFNPKNVLAQAQCKNMLFFGNIVKNSDDYKELQDCALRIYPTLVENIFDGIDNEYYSFSGNYGYYESSNIYNNVGYAVNEFYRFGVVFIYNNGTLSNVYNIVGGNLSTTEYPKIVGELYSEGEVSYLIKRNYIKINDEGWISPDNNIYTLNGNNLNSKGVCYINKSLNDTLEHIFGIKFNIPDNVWKHLKEDLGIRGLFFVRQKRVANSLAQCYLLPMDTVLEAPTIRSAQTDNSNNEVYLTECFLDKDRKITNNYEKRLYEYKSKESISKYAYAGICPDFLLNLPYYNQIFTGSEFKLNRVTKNGQLLRNGRIFKETGRQYDSNNIFAEVKICSVTEDVPTVAIENQIYRLEIGETEESFRFGYADEDTSTYDLGSGKEEDVYKAINLVRGKYSPYLAIYSQTKLEVNLLYNIYRSGVFNTKQEFQNRMDSSEPFYSISDRYNFEGLIGENEKTITCYRGDCYINTFTYRLNRNFNDPTLPNNDLIIDENTWKDNYKSDQEKWADISRADLNAVQMGSWITFKVISPYNYALRSQDSSHVAEAALMGSPRSFYPKSKLLWRGENKIPDSYLYNDAYRENLGYKCYFTLDNVNYIKNTFSNRILYSAISIQDSYKNNYRYSLSTYFRDYSQEYGGIMKLIGFEGYLLVVFEHAITIAVINERVLTGTGDGEPVFINTSNVLPEELTIISDTYGSLWPESIVKSESGYVYGVDTIARKIWRVKLLSLEILSDFKVGKFLNDNITLGERELIPTIGLKNVKTHYNNNKKDVLFTFYDDVYKDEEKVWNLCYNEILPGFVTFYSWIPSYSENIDTLFFTFNRDTSKCLSLLYNSNYNIKSNLGVLVDSPVLNTDNQYKFTLHYRVDGNMYETVDNQGFTKLKGQVEAEEIEDVKFTIEKDHFGFHKLITPTENTNEYYFDKGIEDKKQTVILLEVTPSYKKDNVTVIGKTETVALILKDKLSELTTDFYLHGQSGIFDITESVYPTHWYGKSHPFEFEFIVNEDLNSLKIFENLILISNKVEPESFHFEIEGDNYEFSLDKINMYFRLEATKNLYLNLGSDILYDRKFTDIASNSRTNEAYYRLNNSEYTNQYYTLDRVYPVKKKSLNQQVKSSIFPLYYNRVDTYDLIYHDYREMLGNSEYDFKNLSGSEIKWDRKSNQFNVVTHIKNSPIDKVGRLRGNSFYKEGQWRVQIPSIIFNLKNEEDWPKIETLESDLVNGPLSRISKETKVPPIVINSIPEDIETTEVRKESLPDIYKTTSTNIGEYINTSSWTHRKESRIRDKWIKIRVRYNGNDLAVIHSLITLYNISYA